MGLLANYVNSYSDLNNEYNKTVSNPSNINWEHYVWTGGQSGWSPNQGESDLETAWNNLSSAQKNSYEANRGSYTSGKALWGAEHYSQYGKREGRQTPFYMWDSTGWDKDQYGQLHWDSHGKYEDRIIAGTGPKFTTDANGNIAITDDGTIGQAAANRYNQIASLFNNSPGGDYSTRLKQVFQNLLSSNSTGEWKDFVEQGGKDVIDQFYLDQKVGGLWDAATYGAQPPAGGFNPAYYEKTYPDALQAWKTASSGSLGGYSAPDLDVLGRYTKDTYLQQHYTNVGKPAGYRGNEAITAAAAGKYQENLTDAEYQLYRDNMLGIDPTNTTKTYLESKLENIITAKDKQQQQMFGALTQDALKQSISELQKAKQKENTVSLMRGMPGYDEIFSMNTTLANSLLGDSGVGGLLSVTQDPRKVETSLTKSLSNMTGFSSNSAVYNWQQWFDNVLTKRYSEGVTVSDAVDPQQQYAIDKEFATKFITDYLKPRFDTSRSMDEFVSYMDVIDKDQNIFQTQTALDSLKQLAQLRSQSYLDQIKNLAPSTFNADFYFNPSGNIAKESSYADQASAVSADWEKAKAGDPFWAAEAYRYGLNLNDKAQFAQLHYEVKGRANGYDPADDVVTYTDVRDYIDKNLIPAVEDRKVAIGDTSFLQFVTPEEFADKLIQGVDPVTNKPEWQKLLDQFGLKDTVKSVEELKVYITDALRTGAAKDIRESIKYLNEKKITPTQEKLGATYIQRPEDVKTVASSGETQLYKIFKSAGYQGTEDSFYTEFFPDVNRSEQMALTKAATGGTIGINKMNYSDPFAALSSLGSFFPDTTSTTTSTTTSSGNTSSNSYFKLFEDTQDPALQKSKSGESILGEFTSFFKGF